MEVPDDPAVPFLDISSSEGKSKNTKAHLHIQVHGSLIHNHPKVEATQMSTGRWTGTDHEAQWDNGVLFSLQSERQFHNMGKPWGHCAKWNEPIIKAQFLQNSHTGGPYRRTAMTGSSQGGGGRRPTNGHRWVWSGRGWWGCLPLWVQGTCLQ